MLDFRELSDEENVNLAACGNECAMEYIMTKYKPLVRQRSHAYFLVGADRDDIIQEGMIGLFKAIRDFDNGKLSSFKTFAELCVKRQIITAVKTAMRHKHSPLNTYISLSKPDDDSDGDVFDLIADAESFDPEVIMLSKERLWGAYEAISKALSSFEMKVFELYVSGKSYNDISKSINKSQKSVDNALQRIKRKLSRSTDLITGKHRVTG